MLSKAYHWSQLLALFFCVWFSTPVKRRARVKESIAWQIWKCFKKHIKAVSRHWADGSISKMLAPRTWGPEFDHLYHYKKAGTVVCACNSSTGKAETGKSLGLVVLPASLAKSLSSKFSKRLSQKINSKVIEEWYLMHLLRPHMCTYICMYTPPCLHKEKKHYIV